MCVTVLGICFGLLVIGFFFFYRNRKNQHNVFKSLGIPGPEPHWFWGNITDLTSGDNLKVDKYQEWTKKYGKVYGYFKGPKAYIGSSDLDFLQEVFITKFNNFHGREPEGTADPEKQTKFKHMFNTKGQRWRRLRATITPTFSTAKLKLLYQMISQKTDVLIAKLQVVADSENQKADIKNFYETLTLEVIADACFGLEIDAQTNADEEFMKNCRTHTSNIEKVFQNLTFFKIGCVPMLSNLIQILFEPFLEYMLPAAMWLMHQMEEVIQLRKEKNVKRNDLLQHMLDAEVPDDDIFSGTEGDGEKSSAKQTGEVKESKPTSATWRKKLTSDELLNQSLLFLIAGYETTSATLCHVSYQLALNPDKQKKLQAEIDAHIADDEELTYEKILNIPYLDWVISESLRILPPGGSAITRECQEACTVNGVYIPKGVTIQADVFTIHNDPDIWGPTDPKVFEPERFAPENKESRHPVAYLGFGVGPRHCVGLKFALLEAKTTLVKTLRKFSFVKCDETPIPMKMKEALVISPKHESVLVKIVPRVD